MKPHGKGALLGMDDDSDDFRKTRHPEDMTFDRTQKQRKSK